MKALDYSDAKTAARALAHIDPSEFGPEGAMNVVTDHSFGTVSSLVLALPACDSPLTKPRWLFAAGRPDQAPYEEVILC